MTDNNGPSPEQVRELLHETTALLTRATTPGEESVYVAAQAQRAFNLSPPHAMVALALFAVMGYWRIAETIGPDEQGLSRFAFPREPLMESVPPERFPVTASAVELAEALVMRGPVSPKVVGGSSASPKAAVERLMRYDFDGYLALMGVVLAMAGLVVDLVPEIQNSQEFISVEALKAEQQWYANGESLE